MVEIHRSSHTFIVFNLYEGKYGLPLENVVEIVRMVAVTKIPKSPAWLSGVINFRGDIVPIVELRSRLDLPTKLPELNMQIILVQEKKQIIGLIVDRTESVVSFSKEDIKPAEEHSKKTRFITDIASHDGQLVLILDLPRLVAGTEKLFIKSQHMVENELIT